MAKPNRHTSNPRPLELIPFADSSHSTHPLSPGKRLTRTGSPRCSGFSPWSRTRPLAPKRRGCQRPFGAGGIVSYRGLHRHGRQTVGVGGTAHIGSILLNNADRVKRFNLRIRRLAVAIPTHFLRPGVNVLAIDLRATPACNDIVLQDWWSTCRVVSISLCGEGALRSDVNRSSGIQVWPASPFFTESLLGSIIPGRVGQGTGVHLCSYPITWSDVSGQAAPTRMIGVRNGVFVWQVLVSSSNPIRGLKATLGDLAKGRRDRKNSRSVLRNPLPNVSTRRLF